MVSSKGCFACKAPYGGGDGNWPCRGINDAHGILREQIGGGRDVTKNSDIPWRPGYRTMRVRDNLGWRASALRFVVQQE
jgi:hypothetical protein